MTGSAREDIALNAPKNGHSSSNPMKLFNCHPMWQGQMTAIRVQSFQLHFGLSFSPSDYAGHSSGGRWNWFKESLISSQSLYKDHYFLITATRVGLYSLTQDISLQYALYFLYQTDSEKTHERKQAILKKNSGEATREVSPHWREAWRASKRLERVKQLRQTGDKRQGGISPKMSLSLMQTSFWNGKKVNEEWTKKRRTSNFSQPLNVRRQKAEIEMWKLNLTTEDEK